MANTKKAFQPLMDLLNANLNAKVDSIMDKVEALTSAKSGGGGSGSANIVKNDKDEVTHVFCYYHKRWEEVATVEFGKKASSPTGLSNMCKEGTAAWTKQQRDSKKAREELLKLVGKGEVVPSDIEARTADIEKARLAVTPRKDKAGSKSKPGE